MNRLQSSLPIALCAAFLLSAQAAPDPWTLPRDLSAFQSLLDRSPFSLPTAEESSPLADRYTLTGAVAINGEPLVFVMDRTTQERHMVSKTPNAQNIGLVEYLPDPDPRQMRATIRVNGELATISYVEPAAAAQPQGQVQHTAMGAPGVPAIPQNMPVPQANQPPGAVITPGADPSGQQPPRRIIRRRVITGQPGS